MATTQSTQRFFSIISLAPFFIALFGLFNGCVNPRCFGQNDCPSPKICGPSGTCVFECTGESDCPSGFICDNHRCKAKTSSPMACPEEMVAVANTFCIDRYEASRADATATSAGNDDTRGAKSVAGVIPWQVKSNELAEEACQAVNKRLCRPLEWQIACMGPDETAYCYGDRYQGKMCNGIDAFGRDDFHLMPTGAFSGCKNEWGVVDINGSLWEHVAGGNEQTVRGGAYNCGDSATLHRCDYVPGSWSPSARGFRCCLSPTPISDDASIRDARPTDGPLSVNRDAEAGGGCLNQDSGPAADRAALDVALSKDGSTGEGQEQGTMTGCPPEMVPIEAFCMDRYEAAHGDATASLVGVSLQAVSKPGVMPWMPVTLAQARTACKTIGKRLCRKTEWTEACQGGAAARLYSYGNSYQPSLCNGIDTFCNCASPSCKGLAPCPYPHCYGTCGGNFQPMPTGSFPLCISVHGLFDINGNVWEIVDSNDGLEHFRGGAFNCFDSELLHRCDYDATWSPSAKGFRCCKDRNAP
jgi:formylglycine-generating enzyme required for sulfatase activity